jgi:Leucine-rich repeat (LRR) protein
MASRLGARRPGFGGADAGAAANPFGRRGGGAAPDEATSAAATAAESGRVVLPSRNLREWPARAFGPPPGAVGEKWWLIEAVTLVDLSHNAIGSIPEGALAALAEGLERLLLRGNRLTAVPADLAACARLRAIDLAGNDLRDALPPGLLPPALVDLQLGGNARLAGLPIDLGAALPRLERLILTDCAALRTLPPSLGEAARLAELDVSGCSLVELPESIGNCGRLRVLRAARNGLRRLPASLVNCSGLEALDLRDNALATLAGTLPPAARLAEL